MLPALHLSHILPAPLTARRARLLPAGKIQQHGFARNLDWSVASTSADLQPDERDPEVELVLTENDYTLNMWPHKFKVVYTITLHGEQLKTDFRWGDRASGAPAGGRGILNIQQVTVAT